MAFTFFFRDAQILEILIEHALPSLSGQCHIRIWDAGCAHGPELYTIAMLLRENMSEFMFRNVMISATDIDPSFAAQVTLGSYPDGELQRIPANLLERYFQAAEKPGHFQVVDEIRSRIEFSVHDLLSLKPIREGFSLIVCKNVLLHFEKAQRCNVLRMFHAAMRKDGLLAMEHTQKMPEELRPLFQQVAPNAQVYRKIEIPTAVESRQVSIAAWRIDLPESRSLPHRGRKFKVLRGD
jgi:chemotaxis protein methyltransferase CheR